MVDVHDNPVELLISNEDEDRPAMLVALLALAYGLPLTTILAARWSEFDMVAQVWRLPGGGGVPLTLPILRLMRLYLFTNGGEPNSLLVTGRDGGQLSEYEVEWRIYQLARGKFTVRELRDLVRERYKYFETASERIEAKVVELMAGRVGHERIASFRHNTSTNLRNRLGDWHREICLSELFGTDSDKGPRPGH
ncbi:hypothetical protein N7592_23250 [Pseudomonas juntendi]|uniref:hypothetical protein n=1 Tax=Pseudomonas juntendi TaxID=2666183 RepID=UPI00244D7B3C|nr:hypothetical protein [Pseudomonas juntendi]MDG9876065.1 hypothetical protein [Pseudomonas juntendi]